MTYELDPEVHRRAKAAATLCGLNLKQFVEAALDEKAQKVFEQLQADTVKKAPKKRR